MPNSQLVTLEQQGSEAREETVIWETAKGKKKTFKTQMDVAKYLKGRSNTGIAVHGAEDSTVVSNSNESTTTVGRESATDSRILAATDQVSRLSKDRKGLKLSRIESSSAQ